MVFCVMFWYMKDVNAPVAHISGNRRSEDWVRAAIPDANPSNPSVRHFLDHLLKSNALLKSWNIFVMTSALLGRLFMHSNEGQNNHRKIQLLLHLFQVLFWGNRKKWNHPGVHNDYASTCIDLADLWMPLWTRWNPLWTESWRVQRPHSPNRRRYRPSWSNWRNSPYNNWRLVMQRTSPRLRVFYGSHRWR